MLVYIVRDNRPGDFRQCEGVGRALARLGPVELRNVVPNFHWYSRWILADLACWARLPPALALRFLYDFEVETLDPPAIVIASGRRNVAPALFLKRMFGARFIYAGIHDGRHFAETDLVVTPCPRDANAARHVYAPVLNPVTRADFPAPRPLARRADLEGARLGLMIGGESASHRFSAADWQRLADFVAAAAREDGVEWWVTTSRRTPKRARALLRALKADGTLRRFIEYDPALPGSPNEVLGLDGTLVTEDSLAMMSEAITAGRPVVALRPDRVRPSRQDEAVTAMVALGGASVLPISALDRERVAAALLALKPVDFAPIDILCRNLAADPAALARLGLAAPAAPVPA